MTSKTIFTAIKNETFFKVRHKRLLYAHRTADIMLQNAGGVRVNTSLTACSTIYMLKKRAIGEKMSGDHI